MSTTSITHTLSHSSLTDTIPIQIINDDVLEKSRESFQVVLTTKSPGVSVQGVPIAKVTILDNDSK